ncbi:MAG: hypothetical protein AAF847_20570, partial [Bacteroidota bacterium]
KIKQILNCAFKIMFQPWSLFEVGLNCKSVVCGSDEENNGDFISINERLFSKSGSQNIGLQEDNTPNMLLSLHFDFSRQK